MTVEPAHYPLAPSAAHIWGAVGGCRAYPTMSARYPEPDSPESREGTAAHWYLTETLKGREVGVGAVAPNGVAITAEMVDCAVGMLVDVRDTYARCAEPDMRVEQRVYMPIVHEQNAGTPDVVIVDRPRRIVHVWDYKYGHRFVDAAGNLQLIDYAIGVMREVAVCAEWPQWTVTLTVAQPRNYDSSGPIREWRATGEALLDVYVPQLFEAAREARGPDPAATVNPYCGDCTARHACPALHRAAALAKDVSLRVLPVELPPAAVGLELRQIGDAIKRLEALKTGLEAQALGMIRGGTRVPFFTTEYASGREKFTAPAAEVFALGDMFGVDLRKPPEPITPKQARDVLAKVGIDGSVISAYAETPRGALRLARVNDDAAKLAFE